MEIRLIDVGFYGAETDLKKKKSEIIHNRYFKHDYIYTKKNLVALIQSSPQNCHLENGNFN